jgi:hypothetical protein
MPGLKLRTRDNSPACINLTPQGCGVYDDRPAACRYYALGLVSMRKKDTPHDEDSYFIVREEHCLGHLEPVVQTVRAYRQEQDVDLYDDMNREWRQIVLKKRSAGPTIGRPSARSFELFFLASYDIDGFRAFVASAGFADLFEIDAALRLELVSDEVQLLKFGFRLLKQVLFGENTIALRQDAAQERSTRMLQRTAATASTRNRDLADAQDAAYHSLRR